MSTKKELIQAFKKGQNIYRKTHIDYDGVQQWSKILKSNFEDHPSNYKLESLIIARYRDL